MDLTAETDGDARYNSAPESGRETVRTGIHTQNSGCHQQALVPLESETHVGEEIAAHATSPSAPLFQGTLEQNVVYHIMTSAMNSNNSVGIRKCNY